MDLICWRARSTHIAVIHATTNQFADLVPRSRIVAARWRCVGYGCERDERDVASGAARAGKTRHTRRTYYTSSRARPPAGRPACPLRDGIGVGLARGIKAETICAKGIISCNSVVWATSVVRCWQGLLSPVAPYSNPSDQSRTAPAPILLLSTS